MALQKEQKLDSGYDANYWQVALTNINLAAKQAHIEVILWKDEAQRRTAGSEPIGGIARDWSGKEFPFDKPLPPFDDPFWEGVVTIKDVIAKISYLKLREPIVKVSYDVQGNPIVEEKPSEFQDAVDC